MLFRVTSCKQFRAESGLCQVKNHVQTARECHDLSIDFCSFDNSFAQRILCKNSGFFLQVDDTINLGLSIVCM